MHILSVRNEEAYLFDPASFKLFSCAKEDLKSIEKSSHLKSIEVTAVEKRKKKLIINVANTCNLTCVYCNAGQGDYGRDDKRVTLKGNNLKKIIEDIQKIRNEISSIIFFGGEPCLNLSAISAICDVLDGNEVQFHIVTNGTVLNKNLFDLFRTKKFRVTISYDGTDRVNDLLRGTGTSVNVNRFIRKSVSVLGSNNISIAVTYTPEHLLRGISKDILVSELSHKYPNVRIQLQDVEETPSYAGFNDYFYIEQRKIMRKRNNEALHRSFKENPVDWGEFLFNIIDVFLQKRVKNYFCDDLIDGHTIAYDVDAKKYVCHRFWGDNKYILNPKNQTPKHVKNFNRKNKHNVCKKCWAANFCNKCLVEISNLKSAGIFKISRDPCSPFKEMTRDALLNLARLLEETQDRSDFIKNYKFNREKYLLSFYA